MKHDEIIAEKYLNTLTKTSLIYEPDGNVAPDFLLDSNIAVEVRRLTQNYFGKEKVESSEVAQIPLIDLIKNVFNEFDIIESSKTYFVTAYIDRPIGKMKNVKIELIKILKNFLDSDIRLPYEVNMNIGIGIKIACSCDFNGRTFILAGFRDKQRQGWLHAELIKNINYCIEEKTEKIRKVSDKYSYWWLVLINYVFSGVPRSVYEIVDSKIELKKPWERIVIIDQESYKEYEKKNLTPASTL